MAFRSLVSGAFQDALVAQWLERESYELKVAGSNPAGRTFKCAKVHFCDSDTLRRT